ncbi:hypothetical protein ABMA27_015986 [Loxostege sticticalis]|uniref:Integrase catalytic domain-containing protein n=1 Tax=Loxostege sticticalis TaxID=481309 RepID=A0ABR3I518_LOXSC
MATDKVPIDKITQKLLILHAKRDALFSRMQAICDHANNISNESIRNSFLYEIETVDSLRLEFESLLDKINALELESNPNYIISYQSLLSFEDLFCRVKRIARGLTVIDKPQPPPQVDTKPKINMPKLPAIELPEFNGDIRNWPLFYSSFANTVHNNASLSDSDKLYYLLGKLVGKAQSVCTGITPCAENYLLILETLKKKYEDKRLLANAYLDQILDFKAISNANCSNLEHFLDTFASSVAALKNLKLKDPLDYLFLSIALKRMDTETVRSFELDKRGTEIPTFDSFVEFIRDHVRILQNSSSSNVNNKRGNPPSRPLRSTHSYFVTSANNNSCSLCTNKHEHLYQCSTFKNWSSKQRFDFVKSNGYCFNCLSSKHRAINCNSQSKCRQCAGKHHSMLHFDNNLVRNVPAQSVSPAPARPVIVEAPAPAPSSAALCFSSSLMNNKPVSRAPTTVLLATARVIVLDSHGKEHIIRVLLDSASQSNFITGECCQRLNLPLNNSSTHTVVKGIGGSSRTVQHTATIKFFSRFNRNVCFDAETLVVDKVTDRLPSVEVDMSLLSSFNSLPLADDTYAIPGSIDMLIGASIFPHLLLPTKVRGLPNHTPAPHALETVLGFVIVGPAPVSVESYATVSCCCSVAPLESVVRKFWELEEVSVPPILSPDDKVCEDIYTRTTTRDESGRYVVALPFKGDIRSLGDSRRTAENRFKCLERKLEASSKLREAYDAVIREYLEKGYISPAPPDVEDCIEVPPSYIIPHHGVIREDKLTSKLRVVLDGSAKTSTSVSLNDLLYSGQNLQGNLFSIIVNFRLFRIALSADIRQMFLCIGIRSCDRRFQRILYRFSPDEPLKVYQFNRVCFGLKSSPFHALRTVKQLAADEGDSFPKAKETIETGLYMDDYVHSVDTESDAISTADEVIGLMKAGQFDLVKWTSNSQEVLEHIPHSHRLSSVKEFDDSDSHKVLGLCWSPATDLFSLKIGKPSDACTKRTILSCIARIWDLIGFVAPVVLYAKLIVKQLWLCDCDWDDQPPENIVRLWTQFRNELPLLDQIKIPRHVGITSGSVVTLIGFADASEKAYGGVVYFHVENQQEIKVSLCCAKSKVAPRKVQSLARLELCALLLLAKVVSFVIESCKHRIQIDKIFAFSDSTVALCWAHSSPHRWDTFVANRVAKIQEELSPQVLFHVSGRENPADCLSRGLTPAQIIDHPLWFSGPSWAQSHPTEWPVSAFNPTTLVEPPEEKKHSLVSSTSLEDSIVIGLAKRFSSWSKLLRCVVYVCRFAKLLPPRDYISASDLEYAELLIWKEVQRFYFSNELADLQAGKTCSRSFQRLSPFLSDGLIRVGGRLSNSQLEFHQKHPIILPRKDHIVELLIDYHHKVNCHAGPDLLMSLLRQRYWILSARSLIRNRVHKCIPCFRLRPKPTFPMMADHRSCRVVETAKPFVHTGTDFAGPFKVTVSRGRGIRSTKAYVCLFVCMTTRAVHVELVGDLSTPSFLGAFKRFLSRRGPVSHIYSDNGTNYVGAKRMLSELQTFLSSKYFRTEFAHVLSENRITWSLNTPTASHFGGNYEANIKSLKSHLYRIIGEQILSFEELSTVLAQVEAVMNSRPLCRTLSSDPSEPLALTPAHFLTLTPLKYLPARDIDEDRLHLLSRHSLLDKLVQSFWKRWKRDYLHTLQSRQKWNTPANPITVGTVVVLTTENAPPLHWPLGIVEEVFPGSNGVTRIVRVRTKTGSYLRPVVRLCPLPNM